MALDAFAIPVTIMLYMGNVLLNICRQHCSAGRIHKDKYIVSLSFYIIIYHKLLCTFFLIIQYYFHVTATHLDLLLL